MGYDHQYKNKSTWRAGVSRHLTACAVFTLAPSVAAVAVTSVKETDV